MNPESYFHEIGRSIADSKKSNMFGVLCYKLGRRPYILFHQDEIICKLFEEASQEAMELEGAAYFAPMGPDKPMRNWVQIPFVHQEQWPMYAQLAFEFVQEGR